MGEQIETVDVVKYREMLPGMAMFEVLLYTKDEQTIPIRTFKRIKFTRVNDGVNKVVENRNPLTEKYTNPSGQIKVTITDDISVTLEKAE